MNGEFGCDASEQYVAVRVAPEDEVAVGDVGVGNGSVVLDGSRAAELESPFANGVGHGGGGPFANLVVHGLASRTDHDEGVHEGVVDGTLEAVTFFQVVVRSVGGWLPKVFFLFVERAPGTVSV